jgi:2-methylthioadenine synthetase
MIAREPEDAPEIDGVVYLPGVRAKPGDKLKVEIVASDEHDLEGRLLPSA